jgi:hypothetical protein
MQTSAVLSARFVPRAANQCSESARIVVENSFGVLHEHCDDMTYLHGAQFHFSLSKRYQTNKHRYVREPAHGNMSAP